MKLIHLITLAIMVIPPFGCRRDEEAVIEYSVRTHFDEKCPIENTCELKMSDLFPEDWERVCFFAMSSDLEEIESVIGSPFPYFEDIGLHIIFLSGKSIVYHESYYYDDFDGAMTSSIVFQFQNNSDFACYQRNESNLIFHRISNKNNGASYAIQLP